MDNEKKNNNEHEPYQLRKLLEPDAVMDVQTQGNVLIPLSLTLLSNLVPVKAGERAPSNSELLMFANMIIEQRCNPYLGECWLVEMHGKYQPIIAAQKRIGKAQSMPSYNGYEWGWIDKQGVRHEAGRVSKAKREDVIGVWGEVHFKDNRVPFYHEISADEYPTKSGRRLTMLLKTCRDQAHKYAYADAMGNLVTENEVDYMPDAAYEPTTPKRADRQEPKEVESIEVIDNAELLQTLLDAIFTRIEKDYNYQLTEAEMRQVLTLWADELIDIQDGIDTNPKNPATYPPDFIKLFIEDVGRGEIPANVISIFEKPESKEEEHWHCSGCNEDFEQPIYTAQKEPQCPKCFSLQVKKVEVK